ncbi:MAG: isopentenyl-diphosphate Delta-isomerase [Candidatus Pacebacteria bacterium]|nr:isopentenyl-diphosphate Delta-isomerase [Candidatus Paceibacterota bacterium]
MFKKQVILVDENDNQIGEMEKLKAHQLGALHRSFSIFIFNLKGEMLLQKRSKSKYHSPGLWSNACCSHPENKKSITKEAQKRLEKEMGIKLYLREILSIVYKAKVGDLIEHEFDHIFIGTFNGSAKPNKKEVEAWKWVAIDELRKDIAEKPEIYAEWFKIILEQVIAYYGKNKQIIGLAAQ